ncbi:class I SAM-dependent rRNA methyltransferase [Fervidibacter sacchari]|uniref:23S rRNA (Cytosine1962-C5)-methyltransferase n=1 Tax=Candidatus Fervidibacter sacchari TaxID=1448929 RepID=A0ABT2EQD1_9BACT|nr:class I SAM-dependent rRNA methyltransferase [Candidatus Fervidibacter sacchari]MCS3920168.1 23S rRNA (cytosine1962-C5)-methyltransferase [Candidatus Fervidibacter sacchari]WKU16605.1 class I SAM-dependent rRNA methyltransferase [Candidatus Fervidibacter sacchari]
MRKWVKLKAGKSKKVQKFYPLVYRDEVAEVSPSVEDGDLATLLDERGKFLAWGTFSAKSHVAFRVLTLQDEPVDRDFFANRLQKAFEQRKHLREITNAVRLVHAEADFLPGLIVDRYDEFAVIQVRTKGMERLRDLWFEPLLELLKPRGVYERSDMEGRKEEGLTPFKGLLYGTIPERIEIVEHGLRFLVDVERGLKTGFYLDQRDNRKLVSELVQPGEQFLDLFAYTGAFSVYAATKGAECTAIEQHKHLVELGLEQAKLNGVKVNFRCGNVFEELPKLASEGRKFDFIVIDPPAIAKSEKQIASLRKAIHRVVSDSLRVLKPGGRMLVCTCVYHMDWSDLIETVRFAASDLNVPLRILAQTTQATDHPIRLHIPESQYLRCLLLQRDW